jgi:hypothetical protein
VTQMQDSAGESTATQYHAHEHLPYATPRGSVDCSTPTARFSPLLAQPMTPVLLHPRTAVMHSPAVAERPVFEARHNHPDFATIYAFLGSLFDPVRAPIRSWLSLLCSELCSLLCCPVLIALCARTSAEKFKEMPSFEACRFVATSQVAIDIPGPNHALRIHLQGNPSIWVHESSSHPSYRLRIPRIEADHLMHVQACAHINHEDVLVQMAPVDRETACLLMHNLAGNLVDPPALSAHLRAAMAMDSPAPLLGGTVPPVYHGVPPLAHVPGSLHAHAAYGSM